VTANLTVLVPAAVMIGLAMLITRARHAASMLIPPVVIGLVYYFVSPIRMAHRESFYYGARSLRDCLDYLAAVALAHNFGPWGWNGETWWKPGWRECAAIAVVAMSVAAVWTEAPVLFRRAKASPLDWTLFFAAAVFTGSWTVLLAAHVLVGLPYPLDRTGLYFFPLAGLIVAGLIAKLRAAPRVRALCATLGVLIALEYALELNWRQFVVWRYDADNKTIAQVLAAQTHAQPVRLGLSWPLEPAFHYYRETRGLTWLAPLTREGPDGRYDYYVLIANEQDRIARYHLRVIYRGPVSGTVLAQPNRN